MKRVFKHFLLAIALVFTFVLFSSDSVQAATKPIRTFSDAPVKCSNSKGAFHGKFTMKTGQALYLQGWVAADEEITDFSFEFRTVTKKYTTDYLGIAERPDVKNAYPQYKYCLGFVSDDLYRISTWGGYGQSGTLKIYATIGGVKTLIGQYDVVTKDMMTCSDFPVTVAPQYGPFYAKVDTARDAKMYLQGWVAVNASVTNIWGKLSYVDPKSNTLKEYLIPLKFGYRKDVKKAYPKFSTCVGYELDSAYLNLVTNVLKGSLYDGYLRIYAMINGEETCIGLYDIDFK